MRGLGDACASLCSCCASLLDGETEESSLGSTANGIEASSGSSVLMLSGCCVLLPDEMRAFFSSFASTEPASQEGEGAGGDSLPGDADALTSGLDD